MGEDQRDELENLLAAYQQAQEYGDVQKAESIAIQCLLFTQEAAEKEPNEHLRLLAEASEHENAARWEEAESAYRSALALAEVEGNPGRVFTAHDDLRALFAMRGMPDKALTEARAAVEAARKVMKPVLAMALRGLCRCYLALGDLDAASATADELVEITPAERIYDVQRARALLLRAQCRLVRGSLTEVQADLDIAWQILAPQAKASMFAGVQSALAEWWELTAEINTQKKDAEGAARAMEEAVVFRRTVSQLPQLAGPYKYHALAKTLMCYGTALLAANRAAAANDAFEESQAIQRRIGVTLLEPRQ